MIVGTAGHIDHGKTSLVRKLTGVDTDRLKEEKARGISIDLGFAYWPRPSGEIVGFVDVPGHEGLVHNMLAGATGIDFVVLVIAADDGVMPQTREHLAIMDLLGLERGLVALNKCDLVAEDRLAAGEARGRGGVDGHGPRGVRDRSGLGSHGRRPSRSGGPSGCRGSHGHAAAEGRSVPSGGRPLVHAYGSRHGCDWHGHVRLGPPRRPRPGRAHRASRPACARSTPRTDLSSRARRGKDARLVLSGPQISKDVGAARRCCPRSCPACSHGAHRCQPARAAVRAAPDRAMVSGQGAPCRRRGAGTGGRAARRADRSGRDRLRAAGARTPAGRRRWRPLRHSRHLFEPHRRRWHIHRSARARAAAAHARAPHRDRSPGATRFRPGLGACAGGSERMGRSRRLRPRPRHRPRRSGPPSVRPCARRPADQSRPCCHFAADLGAAACAHRPDAGHLPCRAAGSPRHRPRAAAQGGETRLAGPDFLGRRQEARRGWRHHAGPNVGASPWPPGEILRRGGADLGADPAASRPGALSAATGARYRQCHEHR